MLEVEGERAKRRQVRKANEFVVMNSSPQNEKGAARQIVADKLGSAPQKVTQAAAVVKAIDEMEQATVRAVHIKRDRLWRIRHKRSRSVRKHAKRQQEWNGEDRSNVSGYHLLTINR